MAAKPHYRASLVVESTGAPSSVRSAGTVSATPTAWSRLYKASGYHIDLAFRAESKTAELRGQLLPPADEMPKGKAALEHLPSQKSNTVALSPSGTFLLPVKQGGPYRLTLRLAGATLEIADLDMG